MASRTAMSSALWEWQKEENEGMGHCKGYMLSSNLDIVWNFSQQISCSPIYPAYFFPYLYVFLYLERWVLGCRWSDGPYRKLWACSVKLFEVHCKANVCSKLRAGCWIICHFCHAFVYCNSMMSKLQRLWGKLSVFRSLCRIDIGSKGAKLEQGSSTSKFDVKTHMPKLSQKQILSTLLNSTAILGPPKGT